MRLLPDIILNENNVTLSIQSPYTINGRLIVECEYIQNAYDSISYRNLFCNTTIIFVTDDHSRYASDYELIKLKYQCLYNENISEFFYDENELQDGFRCTFDDYLRAITAQCEMLDGYDTLTVSVGTHSASGYYWDAYNRLTHQNRLSAYNAATVDSTVVSALESIGTVPDIRVSTDEVYYFENGSTISTIRTPSYRTSYSTSSYGTSARNISLDLSNVVATSEKKYIHAYNYKPEYIKHYMPDEDSSALLLGAEIEVDCGGESEEHARNVLEIICGTLTDEASMVSTVKEDKMFCTHDGSLRNGIEFDTMPCTLEYHKKEMKYKEMFEYLDKHGYKAHDTTTCGLHVHADRSYLGKSKLVQQLTISKILYILEKFNDEICVIARRNNEYSRFVGKDEVNESLDVLYNKYKNTGKKVALNLQHENTIEFRMFKGTLKYETFLLTLEFVKDIIDYAKKINIEEIELMKWNDLMDTFSDELKEYYNERLKKEKEKASEKVDDKIDLANTVEAYGELSTLASYIDSINIGVESMAIADSISSWSRFGSIAVSGYDLDTSCGIASTASHTHGNADYTTSYVGRPYYEGCFGTIS